MKWMHYVIEIIIRMHFSLYMEWNVNTNGRKKWKEGISIFENI